MNKIIKICLLLVVSFGCNDSDEQSDLQQLNCLSMELQNGVVAFYPFNNGSLNDESGNNFNLTNSTNAIPETDRFGNLNCAFSFSQSNDDYLLYPNPTFLDDLPLNGISISFWYRTDNFGSGTFLSRDEGSECGNRTGQWSVKYTNAIIQFGINENDILDGSVNTTEWEHIVVKAIGNNLEFYRNGTLIEQDNTPNNCDPLNPSLNQGDLILGKLFDGRLDDLIIYDRLLTEIEITELYNLTSCCN